MRRWVLAMVLGCGALSGIAWGSDASPALPSQETFRDWPSGSLVDGRSYWLPWTWASFKRATLFGRPVLLVLDVGWNRKSREFQESTLADPDVLRLINENYISIRVNADLRPDVRERYQTGAWPVVALLLPDGNPMLSQANDLGVARPITSSNVVPQATRFLLKEGKVYWDKWTALLMDVGSVWRETEGPEPLEPGLADAAASERMATWLLANADRADGGFGVAPKFLVPGVQEYAALRLARGLPALDQHSRFSLEQLVASPMFDDRDGGIHRLASAPSYQGIEYEKMLVGNAALVRELVFALRMEDSESLRSALRKTSRFMTSVLHAPDGGFYLAQRADSTTTDGGGYWRGEPGSQTPPAVDPIVLSGASAVAGAALVRAGLQLDDPELGRQGVEALDRVLREAYAPGRGVVHALQPVGDLRIYLTAQADVAYAFADAYETTGDERYRDAARDIVDFAAINLGAPNQPTLDDRLQDGLVIGLLANPRRPLRPNVRIARAMLRLSAQGLGSEYGKRAGEIVGHYSADLASFRVHGSEAALAIEELIGEPLIIRISGPTQAAGPLRRAAVNSPWPLTVVLNGDTAAAKPSATLVWGAQTRSAESAPSLESAIRELTSSGGS